MKDYCEDCGQVMWLCICEKEEKMANDKCRFCGLRGLVLSTINADYVCEHCGEWQDAVLNSGWEIVA